MCAECRAYSHSITLSIPECARSAAHIYISLHWVFLNVRGVPRILTFYNTKHSWICAAPRTYSQSIAFSIPKYPEYARHPAHTHQFLGLVFSRYARHTAHTHQFLRIGYGGHFEGRRVGLRGRSADPRRPLLTQPWGLSAVGYPL